MVISNEERKRIEIVGYYKSKIKPRVISVKLDVNLTTVYRVLKKYKEHGHTERCKGSGHPFSLTSRHLDFLKQEVAENIRTNFPKLAGKLTKKLKSRCFEVDN